MSKHNWLNHMLHAVGHQAHHERHAGNTKGANALVLFGVSLLLMPIPIVGIPLMIYSIAKVFSTDEETETKL
jgi:hypothetical protein